MTKPLEQRILRHIADVRYTPQRLRELASELGIESERMEAFSQALNALVAEGRVVLGADTTVGLPPPGRQILGTFRLNRRGFGFVVPESPMEHGDLFVPEGQTGGALTGDMVRAKVIHAKARAGAGRSPYYGQVTEIIKRAERQYVGNLKKRGPNWIVEVDGRHLPEPIVIRDPHAKNAHEGDKVVVEMITYPDNDEPGEGVILEVLGKQGEPDVETTAVMRAYGLAGKFEEEQLAEARAVSAAYDDKTIPPDREDLTSKLICTIDPPDAKDFDDAINIEKFDPPQGDTAWELGVHIADVAQFVKHGSALDREAYARGNSAYLPRKVIPMLPEVLSNGVCSLQEGVNRYCKSVFIRYDAEGHVLGHRFANTVIRSAKRLTYREAQALIDDDLREAVKHTRGEPKYSRPLIQALKLMDELAKVIRKRRFKHGMVVLDLPDVELVFDDSGRVTDAVPEDDAFTHKLIEMFMVEANEAAARTFDSLSVPMIRRIHPDPPVHDMTELRQFARVAGFNIPQRPSRGELQALLDSVRGKPAQYAVHLAVLRTLSKAEYSPLLIGHFALASEHYTHFTSPIRRYPDLIVHRALQSYIDATAGPAGRNRNKLGNALRNDPRVPDEGKLFELGKHCSQTERNAEAAEHDLTNYLVLELLGQHLGDDYAGTVTGVTGSGIFVQLDRYLVDGFVGVNELPSAPKDRWRLNRATGALVAERSGKTITIGDRFTVRIAKVNPVARQLDLAIISPTAGASAYGKTGGVKSTKPRRQPKGARQAHQASMKFKQKKQGPRGRRRR